MGKATVLSIDSDELSQDVLRTVLRDAGYEVIADGGEGDFGALLKTTSPDIVLLGSPAAECRERCLCRDLRGTSPRRDLPIIVLLRAEEERSAQCPACRAADLVLLKPIRPDDLRREVGILLGRSRPRGPVSTRLREGQLFLGRYRILGPLGSGANSSVYRARDTHSEGQPVVALKAQHSLPAPTSGPTLLRRILREAYQHSRLDHRNIVRMLDFGHASGAYFLVMEHVDGVVLTELLSSGGPLPERRLASIGLQVAGALAYLAESDLVHRDIKASNIMIGASGRVRILDFGLARGVDGEPGAARLFSGTPVYASPESLLPGRRVDIRSDVYSLGVTLYLLATGVFPFSGSTEAEIRGAHLRGSFEPVGSLRPDLSSAFRRVVQRMLARNPSRRPRPADLAKAFRPLQDQ